MYTCEECGKSYVKYNSFWKHKKDKHINNNSTIANISGPIIESIDDNSNQSCDYCYKSFSSKYNRDRHMINCKVNPQIKQKLVKKKTINELNDTNESKLVNILQHIKESKAGNRELLGGDINNTHNKVGRDQIINSNNTNTNNNIINIVTLGNENLSDILDNNEQIKILNQRFNCFDYMVDYVHFNEKYPQFHNILINDLKSNKGQVYNENRKDFDVVRKDNILDNLIESRLNDIEDFLIKNSDKVKKTTRQIIEKFIKNITYEFDKKNSKYMKDKKDDIQVMMYNKRDVVKKTHNVQ